LKKRLQDIDLDIFNKLSDGDILLIDSTHVSKIFSDVNLLLFEILPSLSKGVYIHFHDIFFPFEYPKSWMIEGRAWNEAYILRAFLQYNNCFSIEFFTSYLDFLYRDVLIEKLPLMKRSIGGSIWIKKLSNNEDIL
jgi:hypothetical protein